MFRSNLRTSWDSFSLTLNIQYLEVITLPSPQSHPLPCSGLPQGPHDRPPVGLLPQCSLLLLGSGKLSSFHLFQVWGWFSAAPCCERMSPLRPFTPHPADVLVNSRFTHVSSSFLTPLVGFVLDPGATAENRLTNSPLPGFLLTETRLIPSK